MSETNKPQDDGWPRGWEGHELAQLRYWRSVPFWEKLAWLEEADEMVRFLDEQRQKAGLPPAIRPS